MKLPLRYPETLGLATGVCLGVAYFLLKDIGVGGGLALFGIGALTAGVGFALTGGVSVWRRLTDPLLIWRGVMFAATQILFCESIRRGSAAAAINASVLGSLVGVGLGRLVLRERVVGRAAFGLAMALFGAFATSLGHGYTLYAVGGGILLGANSTLIRALLRVPDASVTAVLAVPLIHAGCLMACVELLWSGTAGFVNLHWTAIWFVVCLAATQLLSCQVLRRLDSQKTAVLTLTRLPTAALLEYLILGQVPTWLQVAGLGFIAVGAATLFNGIVPTRAKGSPEVRAAS